ncbi:hypothetical protein Cenrod_2681 [Candidatus Symbiobacter mobilis CR]|uniref:Uncharacterized protein n=1 Tax=Candidatus Symbiobacter mobilis CR TaxID=946483 RepID=U5NAX6_9BURK|nr:hypothetical protein Cenrod_2681 [Candidatus Symbiobacter mobilis CR]
MSKLIWRRQWCEGYFSSNKALIFILFLDINNHVIYINNHVIFVHYLHYSAYLVVISVGMVPEGFSVPCPEPISQAMSASKVPKPPPNSACRATMHIGLSR